MKQILILAAAPLVLIAGCSSENQADTAAEDATATNTEMPADASMGATGDSAGNMQSGTTDTTGTMGTTGTTGSTGTTDTMNSGDTTTDQMGRNTSSGTGTGSTSGSGNGTGTTTPPQ